jgi:hypothetical protein
MRYMGRVHYKIDWTSISYYIVTACALAHIIGLSASSAGNQDCQDNLIDRVYPWFACMQYEKVLTLKPQSYRVRALATIPA